MPANVKSLAPEAFARALRELDAMTWRPGLTTEEIGSPQRIAPHAIAISADLEGGDESLATGRLILLHDPAGNIAWGGTFRIVSYVRAEVDADMVTDSLLPEVAWSWLTDALANHGCVAGELAGTVTASYSVGFGEMTDSDRADVEVRSSWTPTLDEAHPLTPHLAAWQELMGMVAGQPALPPGVTTLPTGLA
ncbi:DUF3000 domain-containing protein [Tessaracoccus aquimaris]|nr:DUF3000 domain-containing protein [Tessaracoccus aquimaris]